MTSSIKNQEKMGRLGDFQKFPNVKHQTKLSKMVLDDKKP